jgi:transcription elongation factor GreA
MKSNTITPAQISQEHYNQLSTELYYCTHTLRPEIGQRVADARAHGDLSENAEYHSSRDEQRKNEARIEELEVLLKYAKILERKSSDSIGLTSRVRLQKNDTELFYTLVSAIEADIANAKLSVESPIGKLLYGKKLGDIFIHTTPNGDVQYTVLGIE